MKKKILAVLISVLSIAISFSFGGCLKSCVDKLLEPPAPTNESVIDLVKSKYDIELPKSINLNNYATDVGFDGGIWFCVFDYDGNDEEFINKLKHNRNEKFEKILLEKFKWTENYFYKKYSLPNLDDGYFWYYNLIKDEDGRRASELLIFYLETENQLIIIDDSLRIKINYDEPNN